MREESWYKWFFVAMLVHALILVAFSTSIKRSPRRIDIPYYSVNLVGDIGGGPETEAAAPAPQAAKAVPAPPVRKAAEPSKPKEKERVVSTSKERSLAPVKRKDVPESTTKDDVRRLAERIRQMSQNESTDEKIREMKERVQYMDVTARGKGGGAGPKGFGGTVDSPLLRYQAEVWERLGEAWHPPPSAKADLLTVVTITIRKNGRIADWQIEQRSGNRIYDEAVARLLRSVNDLPPIPPSLNADSVELGFNFHPPASAR
jgi:TonB family protein